MIFTVSASSSALDVNITNFGLGRVLLFRNVDVDFVTRLVNGSADLDKTLIMYVNGRIADEIRSEIANDVEIL